MSTKIHPKFAVTRDVYDLSCERMAKIFKRFDTVVVWFSGGKDSTVCLHVALDAAAALGRLPLNVAHFDEEAIPVETVEYVERVRQTQPVDLKWLCVPIKHRNACSRTSPWWYPWAPEDRALWTREMPPNVIVEADVPTFQRLPHDKTAGMFYGPEYGNVASVMGIRTQESLNRYIAIAASKTGHEAFFAGDHYRHITRAYPIYDWAHEDVWHAPQRFGWDYNRAYDLMQKAGVAIHNQRCAPPFGEQPLERLWTYHVCWPELWDKMTTRVPGAATAGRYARTQLYGYGAPDDEPQKPAHMTWSEFVRMKLNELPEQDRIACARAIRKLLHHHGRKTNDGLPETERHPVTGLSWSQLAKLVVRPDLKGRKVLALISGGRSWVESQKKKRLADGGEPNV